MKKSVLATLLLLLAAPTFSMACDRAQSACGQTLNRVEAYKLISAAENSQEDATVGLRLVLSKVNDQITLGEATWSLVRILQTVGAGDTALAHETFNLASAITLKKDTRIDVVTSQFLGLHARENSSADATANLRLIDRLTTNENDLIRLTTVMKDVLTVVGAGETALAKTVIEVIAEADLQSGARMEDLNASFKALRNAENSNDDALSNLRLVIRAFKVCNNVEQATQELIQIIQETGAGNTAEAQKVFKSIYDI